MPTEFSNSSKGLADRCVVIDQDRNRFFGSSLHFCLPCLWSSGFAVDEMCFHLLSTERNRATSA